MPKVVDNIAKDIRNQAKGMNIATLDATQFWTSIKPFMGPEQLSPIAGVRAKTLVGQSLTKTSLTGTIMRPVRRVDFPTTGTDTSSVSCATWKPASSTSR